MTSRLELFYVSDGDSSVQHFLDELPEHAQQEAEGLIRLLQEEGNAIQGGRLTSHEDGLFELSGQYVQIFYKLSSDNRLILLQGLPSDGIRDLQRIRRKAALI